LKRMVLAGWNGRKAGRGFYDYSDPQKPVAQKL
jgi:3-hydroxybutyryl-CoA dehydrogenase